MERLFVLGFLFSKGLQCVALMEKQRPVTQLGKWNGIGGQVEVGEDVHAAMRREFLEETGVDGVLWRRFAVLEGALFRVDCFCAKDALIDGICRRLQAWSLARRWIGWCRLRGIACAGVDRI